jgi:predicted RNA-binding Zn-ribbon protein involved in translation (DUF1610 family)
MSGDTGKSDQEDAMTPVSESAGLARASAAPACCPHCGDWMIAPVSSEFVLGGEIRHHWDCDSCGESSSTTLDFDEIASSSIAEVFE